VRVGRSVWVGHESVTIAVLATTPKGLWYRGRTGNGGPRSAELRRRFGRTALGASFARRCQGLGDTRAVDFPSPTGRSFQDRSPTVTPRRSIFPRPLTCGDTSEVDIPKTPDLRWHLGGRYSQDPWPASTPRRSIFPRPLTCV